MSNRGNNEKLHRILIPGCMIAVAILTVFFTGCSSQHTAIPAPAVETTVPTVYLWSGDAPVTGTWTFVNTDGFPVNLTFSADGRFSETMNESLSSSGTWKQTASDEYTVTPDAGESKSYRYDANTSTLSDTALPDTVISLVETPLPAATPASDLTDPIIGSWAFVSTDHKAVTLSFSADGQFSETLDGAPSASGTWQQDTTGEYSVILSTGVTKNYRYDAVIDTLYDKVSPTKFITRR